MPQKYQLHGKTQSRISENMSALALVDMTDAELAEREAELAYVRAAKSDGKYSQAELDLWKTLQEMFNRREPINHFVRGMDGGNGFGVQRFLSCAQVLDALIVKACARGVKPDKAMRIAMRRLLLDCLHNWLKGANVPVNPRALLHNIDKLEHAIEQEYPGYIDAGMLSFVLAPLPRSA